MSNVLVLVSPLGSLNLQQVVKEILTMKFETHSKARRELMIRKESVRDGVYFYDSRLAVRPYTHQKVPPALQALWRQVEHSTWAEYGVCFINLYQGETSEIGWHKDDSPSIDSSKPVSVVTLGDARPVELRNTETGEVVSLTPPSGSIYMMPPDFQHKFDHRVPAVSDPKAGLRISLVFRALSGYGE